MNGTGAERGGVWAWWNAFTAIDKATLLYVIVASVSLGLSFVDDDIPGWPWLALAHVLLILLVCLAPAGRRAGPAGRFLGDWYALLLLAGLYGEIGVLTLDAGFQNDWVIQRLEEWVFGSEVAYRWIREMPSPALSWVLHSCYIAYYPILYASPFGLWVIGRREESRRTIFAVMATFYLCYLVFLFFPVAGPRYAFDLANNAATHVAPARFAQWLLDRGDSWGAAFPSSHVAASVVATGMALRYWRPLGLVLLPFTIGLVLAVVYGQFHYAVDAMSGLVLAGLMLGLMWRLEPALAPATSAGAAGVGTVPSVVDVLGRGSSLSR